MDRPVAGRRDSLSGMPDDSLMPPVAAGLRWPGLGPAPFDLAGLNRTGL